VTSGHPTRDEDFDLYALGALDGDEKREFESHLASCAGCQEKLAEARGRIAVLAFAAPPVAPSPAVKQRLMRQVSESLPPSAARDAVSSIAPARELDSSGGVFGRWWAAILVPVGFALAAASIILWTQNRRLDAQLADLRVSVEQERQQLQEAQQVAQLVTARDTMLVPLAVQPGMPKGAAHVMYNQKMGMLMYEGELDPAPANKSYQLWLVPKSGNPISAGVFTPGADKANHFMMKLPAGVAPAAFAVTLEPAGGQPQPTGPKVLVGPVS
jgi:anti-sigma-K factor RskA